MGSLNFLTKWTILSHPVGKFKLPYWVGQFLPLQKWFLAIPEKHNDIFHSRVSHDKCSIKLSIVSNCIVNRVNLNKMPSTDGNFKLADWVQLLLFFRIKSETTNITVNMQWLPFFSSNLFILSDGALRVLSNGE